MPTPASADPLSLAARHAVAAGLADALRAPGGAPERSAWVGGVLTDAWALVAHRHAGLKKSDLGFGEELPSKVDPARVEAWLSLPLDSRRAALQAAFGLTISRDCPPYETEFCKSRDPFHRAQHMADLCGFFRAFGVSPDPESPERPDHAANHLAFVSLLLAKAASSHDEPAGPARDEHQHVCDQALRAFVRDHAAEWIPAFATALHRRCADLAGDTSGLLSEALAALAGTAHFLRAWVAVERVEASVPPIRGLTQATTGEGDPQPEECGLSGNCESCDAGAGSAG